MPFFEPGNFTAGTLIGIVLGYFLEHALANRRSDRESIRSGYNKAAKNFRDAFACVFQAFPDGIDSVAHIVINNFKKQEIAMLEFTRFLERGSKTKFEKAWNDYKECYQEFLGDYESNLKISKQQFLDKFKEFVTELTDFAKHK